MRGCGLTFTRDDEGGGVGAEVEEELSDNVASEETLFSDLVVSCEMVRSLLFDIGRIEQLTETHDTEHDGQNDETTELNRLAADSINGCNGDPVTGDSASADQDQVTDRDVIEDLVNGVTLGVADLLQNGGVVETDTVESDIEEEPGASSTEEDLSVFPLTVVAKEVRPRCLGNFHARSSITHLVDAGDLVRDTLGRGGEVGLDIGTGLDNVAGNVEGVARSLGNGQTVVESNATRHGTEADDHTPHLVDSDAADSTARADLRGSQERLLEASGDDEGDDTGTELAHTLHSEDRAHHSTAPFGGGKLGGNDGTERVVTTDTNYTLSVSSSSKC